MRQVVGRRLSFHVQFDSYLAPLEGSAEGRGGWSAGRTLGGIPSSAEVGGSNSAARPAFSVYDGARLFFPLGGVRNADLDGGGPPRKRDSKTLASVHVRHFLSGVRLLRPDD